MIAAVAVLLLRPIGANGQTETASPADAPPVTATATPSATPTLNPTHAACIGNCDGDPVVTVNEIIQGVNIASGSAPVSSCARFDANRDGTVAVNELVAAVLNLLYGCGVVPPTPRSTATVTATPTASATAPPTAVDTGTATYSQTPTLTPTSTRAATNTPSPTASPTVAISVCGGPVTTLPVLCNLTVIPNPVSRSGTIAFRFGVSDLDGDIDRLCIGLVHPPLEPQTSCSLLVPPHRLINTIETTTPEAASPLQFGGYQVAIQAFDTAGHASNVATSTFQVE